MTRDIIFSSFEAWQANYFPKMFEEAELDNLNVPTEHLAAILAEVNTKKIMREINDATE